MESTYFRKANGLLLFWIAIFVILYVAGNFLKPVAFALFLAALVRPVVQWLEDRRLGRVGSSMLGTLLVFFGSAGIVYLMIYQFQFFIRDLPRLEQEFARILEQVQVWLYNITGYSPHEQRDFVEQRSETISATAEKFVTGLVGSTLSFMLKFLLTMVYLFLFLLERKRFARMIMRYVPDERKPEGREVMDRARRVSHQYLWGRIKVMSILGGMYLVAFLAFGVEYAILLTVFGAIITIIPYVGPFISGVIPVIIYLLSDASMTRVWLFAGVVLVIQLIESYYLEPVLIGKEVHMSPLFIIMAIIIGGMLWGVVGMILFVPMFAVMSILFAHLPPLRPIAELMRNEE